MTTPGGGRTSLTARLRAIAGRPVRSSDDDVPRTRLRTASFEHSHRVWIAPDPPRRWFEAQGIEPVSKHLPAERPWWRFGR